MVSGYSGRESGRKPVPDILYPGQDIERLDVRDRTLSASGRMTLSGMYDPGGGPPIRIFVEDSHRLVRRGHRISARVTRVLDNCACADIGEILGTYLQGMLDNRAEVVPTGSSPLDESGSISHPDYNGGCKGILVVMTDVRHENGRLVVKLTSYRELRADDFKQFDLDPDLDLYILQAVPFVSRSAGRRYRPGRRG